MPKRERQFVCSVVDSKALLVGTFFGCCCQYCSKQTRNLAAASPKLHTLTLTQTERKKEEEDFYCPLFPERNVRYFEWLFFQPPPPFLPLYFSKTVFFPRKRVVLYSLLPPAFKRFENFKWLGWRKKEKEPCMDGRNDVILLKMGTSVE